MASSPAKLDKDYDDWEAKDALSTLQRSEEIKSKPGLHKAALKHAHKQMKSLKKVAAAKPMSKR